MKHSTAFLAKDAEAERKRKEAQAYLKKEGQNTKTLHALRTEAAAATTKSTGPDNTLYLVMKEKAQARAAEESAKAARMAAISHRSKAVNNDDNAVSLATTTDDSKPKESATEGPLPKNWKSVADEASGQTYYWNVVTNETTWQRPESQPESEAEKSSSSDSSHIQQEDALPEGWIAKIHPATEQLIYVNTKTGKSTGERPVSSNSDTEKRPLESSSASNNKRARIL